ncbi:MAG: DMT family transporter [Alphaproteobacteria bacterium]
MNQTKGILCILAAGCVFSFTDTLSKLQLDTYPTGEVMFARSSFMFVTVAIMIWWQGGWGQVRIVNWRLQVLRGINFGCTNLCFMIALQHVPLADLSALSFLSPLILTALAPRFLGEHVDWQRWLAVGIGFCGTIFIIQPSGDTLLWPLLLGACVPLLTSTRDIMTRRLAATDTATGTVLVSTAGTVIIAAGLLPFGFVTPDWYGLSIFALTGILQGVGQFLSVYALVYAQAVVISPFRYFMLMWATIYGYLFFATIPRADTFIGAAVVCATGLYIFFREANLKQKT